MYLHISMSTPSYSPASFLYKKGRLSPNNPTITGSLSFPFVFAADSGEALFFKFCWLAIKGGFYLAVFAFGGPLIALIAIGYMYKKLFEKFKEMKKTEEEEEKEGGDEGGE